MRSTRPLVALVFVAACSTGPAAEPSAAPGPAGPSEPEKIVYEQVKWFEGLEEYVTIHKEFGATWCKRADGRIQDCEEVKREDREAYYRKWGAMTKDFAALLAATPDDQTLPASISFFVQEPPEMFSPDSAVKAAAQELFFENVLSEGKRWADWVVARGGTIKVPTTKSMPMFTMTATPPLYRIMAWTPGITGIRRSGGMKPGEFGFGGSGTTDGVDWIHSQVNNHDGLFGAGMKVGILGAGGGCGLDDEHEAFRECADRRVRDS